MLMQDLASCSVTFKIGMAMKKTILMVLLVAICTGAMAEWVKIGDMKEFDNYVDPSSVRKNGNIVTMWSLRDFNTQQALSSMKFQSDKTKADYDCAELRIRSLALIVVSGKMGSGETIFSHSQPGKWNTVAPGTVEDARWRFACGKK